MMNGMGLPGLVFVLIYLILLPLCFWKIFTKAGYNGVWGLFSLVPFGPIVLIAYLAFAQWPIDRTAGSDPTGV